MKKVYRRMLLFSATVVFLALAPIVILYAMGYRKGPSAVDPRPVGVVYIDTVPRGADVFMLERNFGKTPQAISDVPVGEVPISVQREGYATWEKNVLVRPGLVTELRDIRLFPAERKPRGIADNIEHLELSPNRLLIAAVTTANMLSILDVEGSPVGASLPLRVRPRQLQWAPNSNALLLHNQDGSVGLLELGSERHTLRTIGALRGAKKIMWDQRIAARFLVQTQQNELRIYNLENNTSLRVATTIQDFGADASQMYALLPDGSLARYNLQGQLLAKVPLTGLDDDATKLFVAANSNTIVQTKTGKVALVADAVPLILSEHSLSVGWSPNGQLLYIQTDTNSVHVVNISDERGFLPLREMQLITRLSRPLTSIQWFAGGQHLLLQVEDELLLTEIDIRDHAKTWQVDTTNTGNAQAAVGEDGGVLFYLKRSADGTQLTKLPLILEQ